MITSRFLFVAKEKVQEVQDGFHLAPWRSTQLGPSLGQFCRPKLRKHSLGMLSRQKIPTSRVTLFVANETERTTKFDQLRTRQACKN